MKLAHPFGVEKLVDQKRDLFLIPIDLLSAEYESTTTYQYKAGCHREPLCLCKPMLSAAMNGHEPKAPFLYKTLRSPI